jgi:hypothetical protein
VPGDGQRLKWAKCSKAWSRVARSFFGTSIVTRRSHSSWAAAAIDGDGTALFVEPLDHDIALVGSVSCLNVTGSDSARHRSGAGMVRYRMDIFKVGKRLGRKPALWRRHDIFALNDGAAKLEAEEYYRNHAAGPTFTSFLLCSDGGRFVYESSAKSD